MSEYEVASIVGDFISYAIASLTVFLSMLTGYILIAYKLGDSLTKSQNIAITSIFVSFALFMAMGTSVFFFAVERGRTNTTY
jgi:hypothetical protein